MGKINGITYGTYPSVRPKKGIDKNVCKNCEICKSTKYQTTDNLSRMYLCKNSGCNLFYFSKTSKATVSLGRDTITGKEIKKTFVADTEEEAFANKPINKLNRTEIIDYLDKLAQYSPTTIKERYRIIKRAYEYAYNNNIIKENFMEGYNAIEKPKTQAVKTVQPKISLTLEDEKKLVDYLETAPIYKCKHKNLFLLLLTTGIRIDEVLVLDYIKDIDLRNGAKTKIKLKVKK